MSKQKAQYIESELFNACPDSYIRCGVIKIKIESEKGKSKWINITAQQFRDIERLLIKSELEKED
jgi:hypothetical protein